MSQSALSAEEQLYSARVDAAQEEWLRWKRKNGVAAAGLRAAADEIRKIASALGGSKTQRDLLAYAEGVREHANLMDDEDWLKSPLAMAEKRGLARRDA